jgi:phosphohistidine phosphatase
MPEWYVQPPRNMQVYLLRHGIAEEGGLGKSDADRELTAEGRRRLRDTLRAARQAEVKPSLIISSPLVRAIQTADIAAHVLHCTEPILQSRVLLPSARPEQVWDEIRVHHSQPELMLVGHEPLFSQLAAYLLHAPELQVDFKKGAVLRLDFEMMGSRPKGILRWFLTAKLAGKSSPAVGHQSRTK